MLCAPSLDRTRTAAYEIGERLLWEMQRPDERDPNDERYANRALNGPPGFALAFLALAQSSGDSRFEAAMHVQLRRAALAADRPAPGLFDGISGLRAVAALATSVEPRYRRLVEQCDAFVENQLPGGEPELATYRAYDVISGWAGMRLARCVEGAFDADRLSALLDWIVADSTRWCLPHPLEPAEAPQSNLGMAHGIPGVLAAIAATHEDVCGVRAERLAAAARALQACALEVEDAYVWPRTAQAGYADPFRSVWCFGTGGVAIALLLVARRLGDRELETFAIDALARMACAPVESWRMTQHGLCHGTMGNALIFAAAARATGEELFRQTSDRLLAQTLDDLAANGGRTITRGFDGVEYDAIGELNGVAGIATGLLTLCGDFSGHWLRLHALL